MSLQISLPLGNKANAKNLVFSILTREYPLKLIQLTNFIRKRYGRAVTFQAVRKATLELVEEGVLLRKDNEFLINKEWVMESKKTIDELYHNIYEEKNNAQGVDSIGDEISVFTFNSLNEMMKFWEDLIDHWFTHFKKGDYNLACYQGAHGWEGLLHADREKNTMERLKQKGIKSYSVFTSNTPLDKLLVNFYSSLGMKCILNKSSSHFDKSYYVATYGNLVVQTQYPLEVVKEMDLIFKNNKKLENFNLKELSDIVNRKGKIKLNVTKNINMAKQINASIMSQL